jgi:hypothetical protein
MRWRKKWEAGTSRDAASRWASENDAEIPLPLEHGPQRQWGEDVTIRWSPSLSPVMRHRPMMGGWEGEAQKRVGPPERALSSSPCLTPHSLAASRLWLKAEASSASSSDLSWASWQVSLGCYLPTCTTSSGSLPDVASWLA